MNIKYNETSKIPYIIVDNFYNEEEVVEIWKEIEFLSDTRKLSSEEHTYSAYHSDGKLKKKNLGVFLDDFYKNRDHSNILSCNRKIFDPEFFDKLEELNYTFSFLRDCTRDNTLLSYYGNESYYENHIDESLFTAITFFYKDPKKFEGGNLILSDGDIEIECINNRLVLFPSKVEHEVAKIKLESSEPWMGRYSITSLIFA